MTDRCDHVGPTRIGRCAKCGHPNPAPVNRRTSIYNIHFPGDDARLDEVIARCPVPLAGSGVDRDGTAFIRVRAADDDAARAVASEATGNDPGLAIVTGHGVNNRVV